MFIETKEGQTHATCEEQLKKYGGKAKCCLCNTHDGCTIANSEGMFSPHEMTKAIKHAMKVSKKEQDKIMPPDEFCPECMSLKRKPNKECVNHEKYWIKPTPAKGGDLTLAKLLKEYKKIKRAELQDATESLAEHMVKTIANKHIKVQDTHEGKSHQRHWYLVAQKMVKKLVKEYERVCKESYNL